MIKFDLSNNKTIEFNELNYDKNAVSNLLSLNNIEYYAKKFKSPIWFGYENLDLLKYAFNNKLLNLLFPKYIKIEDLIEISLEFSNRNDFYELYNSYYRLFKLFGEEFIETLFGKRLTHKYTLGIDIKSEQFIKEIRELYKNIAELFLNNKSLYKRIIKEELLYIFYPDELHSDDYWNETTCLEESKKFTRVEDFYRCSPIAYDMAQFNGWVTSYIWIKDCNKCPNFYWTKERLIRLINQKKYKTREEFSINRPGAYHAATRNGWLNDLIPKSIPKKKWDEDACYELAKSCHNISEMEQKSNKAAKYARKNGWVEQYTWFENYLDNLKDFRYCVYLYTDGIAAYIGLTRDYRIRGRHREHNQKKDGKYDALKTYFNNKNKELPEPVILMNNLEAEIALYYEAYYINEYKKNGYLILNKADAGSLGGSHPRYSKEECETIARKYDTLVDFYKNEPNVYSVARRNNWLNDFTWLERQELDVVTYEEAYNEAKKYEYIGEFSKYSQRQYNAAYKKDWLKDYTWLKYKNTNRNYKRPNPTREQCFEAAKQFTKVKQFYNHKTTLCKFSREKGWYDDYIWFESVYRSWTHKRCEQEAHKYTSLSDFELNCYGGYHVSVKEGWIDEFDWLK